MLMISDMTYTAVSAFSVIRPTLLGNGITFDGRSCMLFVFRSRIQGAASLPYFRSKTQGSWGNAFSFKNTWSRTATSFGFSIRNRRFRTAPPRAISFKNRGCVPFQTESVICTRDPPLHHLSSCSPARPRSDPELGSTLRVNDVSALRADVGVRQCLGPHVHHF